MIRPIGQAWHTQTAADTLRGVRSTLSGLTGDEPARRLRELGSNRLIRRPPASALSILLSQFRGLVVVLLIAATGLSMILGDMVEAVAIGAVIVLNAGIGFVIELRARRAMEALQHLVAAHASVWRDGQLRIVDAEQLVPGDVVEIGAGQTVPADGRMISGSELRTDEAALTGESLPVSKATDAILDLDTPLAERVNMVYQGTRVVAGIASVVITATGTATEVGRIGALTSALADEQTPLERRLDDLGRRLVWLALGVAALVGALGLIQGQPWGLMVETAIALSVAAVPEGLPAVATITLAIGLHRMAARHALVRRLPSVEALGSTTVICTDKTRTLTSGDMAVVGVWSADAERLLSMDEGLDDSRHRHVLGIASAASREQAVRPTTERAFGGDPVDRAVVAAAHRVGIDAVFPAMPQLVIPFSSERKLMAAFYANGSRLQVCVKGAPRQVLAACRTMASRGSARLLDEPMRENLLQVNRQLAADGLRVLAVAYGDADHPSDASLVDLQFAGFIGLMDPPAPGVREAIGQLRRAGLRTVMLTGDQRATAQAVGRELGVLGPEDEVIDSRELQTLSPDLLGTRLQHTGAFSRVTPEDKLAIVRALQERGAIVAMLGDGVNDAPALRKADVGVAMGIRGTDVAKEAASIVLQDDRFDTIVAAVEEGRVIFDNIRKCVFYLFSCNLAEILVLLTAALLVLPVPLLPLQILWLNLVTDTFPALALAAEPANPDVMDRPPRSPQSALLSRAFLTSVLFYAGLITAATASAYVWALAHVPTHATTVAFATLALAQTFHLGNARSSRHVLTQSVAFANRHAIGAVVLSIALILVAIYVEPIARALHVMALGWTEWLVVIVCSSIPAIVGQTLKLARASRLRGRR